MELTKESILIKNDYSNYPFRLEMDDIKGYIRLTKNTDKEMVINHFIKEEILEKEYDYFD